MKSISGQRLVLETLERAFKSWQTRGYNVVPAGVAYSGGMDSGVLLWGAVQILGREQVVALWVDHGVRPEAERQAEALLVQENCLSLGIRLKSFGPPNRDLLGQGPEDSFRRFRLEALAQGAQDFGLPCLLTAHHADDQAETLLMRLFQGRSWDGLAGIPEVRGLFFRPFLKLSRQDLRLAADEIGLRWHEDSSNSHTDYLRNSLRNDLLPQIFTMFPRARSALGEWGELWRKLHQSPEVPDSGWKMDPQGATLARQIWESWPQSQKETQLLTVARRICGGGSPSFKRISRRFLETLIADTAPDVAFYNNWKFNKNEGEVSWRWIVEVSPLSYHVRIELNRPYELPGYTVSFHRERQAPPGYWVSLPEPIQGLVWRTLGDAEAWTLPDGKVSDKRWRTRHGGPVGLFQKGLLFAIFDPQKPGMLEEFGSPGLIKEGIFVKLIPRSV
jgi:tRNA(Ile)-lysidine synthetase-like protein